MSELVHEWLVYEQGSHVAISTDWLLWMAAVAAVVVATVAHRGLRRRIWGL